MIKFVYSVQGPTPDQPSEDNRMSEARRSPSGHDTGTDLINSYSPRTVRI